MTLDNLSAFSSKRAPRLSVLMPLYNGEHFLPEALESILSQTFTDFELLIVDDGSTDGSVEIVRSFCARDKRIRVFFLGKNFGISTAMNRGLREARAPLVARMDSDDYCAPSRFAAQVSYMDKHADIYVLGCRVLTIDEDGNRIEKVGKFGAAFARGRRKIADYMVRGAYPLVHPTLIYRTAAVLAIGGYREVFPVGEDLDLYERMFVRYGCVFGNLSNGLHLYRCYPGSLSFIGGKYSLKQHHRIRALISHSSDCFRRGLPDPLDVVKHLPLSSLTAANDDFITIELVFYLNEYRNLFYKSIPKIDNFRSRARDLRRLRMIMSKLSRLPKGSKTREFLYSRLILLILPDMPSSQDERRDFLKNFDDALFDMNGPVYSWDYCNNCICVARGCLGFGEWKRFLRYMFIAFRLDFIYTLRFIIVRSFVHLIK